jgi:hypothetical protein
MGNDDSLSLSVCKVHIYATRWPSHSCLSEKVGYSKGPKAFKLKIFNFGIHFWPRVTLVNLLNVLVGIICDKKCVI